MAEVTLPFGKEKMKVTIPDNRLNGILVSKAHEFQADKPEEEIVKDALALRFIPNGYGSWQRGKTIPY